MENGRGPALIGSSAAARILGIAPATLRRWVKSGKIKPEVKYPSGYLRFNPKDVERLKREITVN